MDVLAGRGLAGSGRGETADCCGLLVIVCTYNEMENLPRLVTELEASLPGCHLLVVDDGSPDGTGEWAAGLAAERSDRFCLQRPEKGGLGSATLAGFRWGLDRNYRWIATLDADFSHEPAQMADLFLALESDRSGTPPSDLAIGSRYVRGGKISGWPLSRKAASRLVNLAARLVLAIPARDCSTAMRIYRAETLRRIPLDQIRSRGFGYLEELLYRIVRDGGRIVEVPVHFRDRVAGKSKATILEGWNAVCRILAIRFDRKPDPGSGRRN